jgi:hypothetical protein
LGVKCHLLTGGGARGIPAGEVDVLKSAGRLNTSVYLQKLTRGAPIPTFDFLSRSCNKNSAAIVLPAVRRLRFAQFFDNRTKLFEEQGPTAPTIMLGKLDATDSQQIFFCLEWAQHFKGNVFRIERHELQDEMVKCSNVSCSFLFCSRCG